MGMPRPVSSTAEPAAEIMSRPCSSTESNNCENVNDFRREYPLPTTVLGEMPPTLEKVAKALRSGAVSKIVLMTGAGISVSAGIPDFRSTGTGLFSQLSDMGFEFPESPEILFHIRYFKYNPEPFYSVARKLFPGNAHPTDAHFFSVLLQRKGVLLRHYTQNIDNLEILAGLAPSKLVEAHGSFSDAHCIRCHRRCPIGWLRKQLLNDGSVRRCRAPRPPWLSSIDTEDEIAAVRSFATAFTDSDSSSSGESSSGSDIEAPSEPSETINCSAVEIPGCGGARNARTEACDNGAGFTGPPTKSWNSSDSTSHIVDPHVVPGPIRTASSDSSHLSDSLGRMKIEDSPHVGLGREKPINSERRRPNEFLAEDDPTNQFAGYTSCEKTIFGADPGSAIVPEKGAWKQGELRKQDEVSTTLTDGETPQCGGLIKPDIVFYGEGLPKRFAMLCQEDFATADLLIVLGTSLRVYPFAALIGEVNYRCPRLLINREVAGEDYFPAEGRFRFSEPDNYRDVHFMGDCDDGVRQLCHLAGWLEELDAVKSKYYENTQDNWRLLEKIQPPLSPAELKESMFLSDDDNFDNMNGSSSGAKLPNEIVSGHDSDENDSRTAGRQVQTSPDSAAFEQAHHVVKAPTVVTGAG